MEKQIKILILKINKNWNMRDYFTLSPWSYKIRGNPGSVMGLTEQLLVVLHLQNIFGTFLIIDKLTYETVLIPFISTWH